MSSSKLEKNGKIVYKKNAREKPEVAYTTYFTKLNAKIKFECSHIEQKKNSL